jgi:hypothetical protein
MVEGGAIQLWLRYDKIKGKTFKFKLRALPDVLKCLITQHFLLNSSYI